MKAALAWLPAVVLGAIGGAFAQQLGHGNVAFGAVLGSVLAALAASALRPHTRDLGDGLVHGLAVAWLAWLLGALAGADGFASACSCEGVRERLPALLGWLLAFGMPFGAWLGLRGREAGPRTTAVRACVVGGAAGVGVALTLPTLVEHAVPGGAPWLRSGGALLLGVGYGLLFQRGVRGLGSSFGHGIAFGVLVWCVGPLTALPWLRGQTVDWSANALAAAYGSFVAHVVFGLALGLVHAALDRLWQGFFVATDPLRRDREGIGGRSVHALGLGALAGLGGGLAFAPLMWDRGMLPFVAQALGGDGALFGLCGHLLVSVVAGGVYGVLFRAQVAELATALGAGLVFGLVAWFLGQLTWFPLRLGEPVDWSQSAAAQALPSLVGHLLFGVVTAACFTGLEALRARGLVLDPRWLPPVERLEPARTAPLWLFVLGVSLLLPIALG